ncbi:CerR family C-terminal domain-containing protein [Massilia sp. METH4]|uniref:TetR/AcrR family transcriptional regulator n=1 Tax=Massilia sp. METH4 TaxID=3123041 RepID=UPI0030CC308E
MNTKSGRAARPHGDATRQQLLDVAGQVFAEKGYADATSKEICTRAGTNIAAVNYHFGGRDPLYEAVLVEAHQHLVTLEEMQHAAAMDGTPLEKLRVILGGIVRRATSRDAHWGTRVVIRELLSPTAFAPTLVHRAIEPKARVMLGIVAQVLGLAPDNPGVQRGLFLLMAPCLALLVAPRGLRKDVFPALGDDTDGLVEDMLAYVEAGLSAIARRHGPQNR